MSVCGYEFNFLLFKLISHSFATLTREISTWTPEDKIRIHIQACNILYNIRYIITKCCCCFTIHVGMTTRIKTWDLCELLWIAPSTFDLSKYSPLFTSPLENWQLLRNNVWKGLETECFTKPNMVGHFSNYTSMLTNTTIKSRQVLKIQ